MTRPDDASTSTMQGRRDKDGKTGDTLDRVDRHL